MIYQFSIYLLGFSRLFFVTVCSVVCCFLFGFVLFVCFGLVLVFVFLLLLLLLLIRANFVLIFSLCPQRYELNILWRSQNFCFADLNNSTELGKRILTKIHLYSPLIFMVRDVMCFIIKHRSHRFHKI